MPPLLFLFFFLVFQSLVFRRCETSIRQLTEKVAPAPWNPLRPRKAVVDVLQECRTGSGRFLRRLPAAPGAEQKELWLQYVNGWFTMTRRFMIEIKANVSKLQ